MATYSADIEAAAGFMPQNQFTNVLEQYRKKQKRPQLLDIQFERPGVDQQSYYEQLNWLKEANRSATEVALTSAANKRAREALSQANQIGANISYDLSGVNPRFTGQVQGALQSKGTYGKPLGSYRVTSGYGMRRNPVTGRYSMHTGIDLAAPNGSPVYATHSGLLRTAYDSIDGNHIFVSGSGGLVSSYSHLSRFAVKPGTQVTRGQLIGYVGSTGRSTGPHLHYGVKIGGRTVNPAGYF